MRGDASRTDLSASDAPERSVSRGNVQSRLAQDDLALFRVGAPHGHDDGQFCARLLRGQYDPARGGVGAQNAAEQVHQDHLHLRVGDDDPERLGDGFFACAASHVQEVRRLSAGPSRDVHGRHCQACSVHHAAHSAALQLHVGKPGPRRPQLLLVVLRRIVEVQQFRVPEQRVVFQVDLGVQRNDAPVRGDDERVDFDQRAVLFDKKAI